MTLRLILASASPRRRAILAQLGVPFRAVAVDVDEVEEGDAEEVARGNAARKARAALAGKKVKCPGCARAVSVPTADNDQSTGIRPHVTG